MSRYEAKIRMSRTKRDRTPRPGTVPAGAHSPHRTRPCMAMGYRRSVDGGTRSMPGWSGVRFGVPPRPPTFGDGRVLVGRGCLSAARGIVWGVRGRDRSGGSRDALPVGWPLPPRFAWDDAGEGVRMTWCEELGSCGLPCHDAWQTPLSAFLVVGTSQLCFEPAVR